MKVVFINLHHNNFLLNNYSQLISGYKIKTYKHKFLLDFFINGKIEIVNLIVSNNVDNAEVEKRKADYVFEKNNVRIGSIRNTFDTDVVDSMDICFVYFHNYTEYIYSKRLKCKKVLMSNHFIRVKKGQYFNLYEDGFVAFVGETDFSENAFVNTYFNLNNVEVVVCPYIYTKRFCQKKSLDERKNKLLAIGTLSTVKGIEEYSGYVDYFETEWVQPFGAEIKKRQFFNRRWLDSEVSYINQGHMSEKKSDSVLIKSIKRMYNSSHERQGKYLSYDIVDKYNEYKIFVRPEEMVGNPSINMVEGMACGTVYMGANKDMYEPLGMKPGIHYILYDGTFKDLKKQFLYYINQKERLSEISERGKNLVRERFEPNIVAKDFWETIKQLSSMS